MLTAGMSASVDGIGTWKIGKNGVLIKNQPDNGASRSRMKFSTLEGNIVATYVMLYNFTDQGLKNIKYAAKRVEAVKKAGAAMGATIKEIV